MFGRPRPNHEEVRRPDATTRLTRSTRDRGATHAASRAQDSRPSAGFGARWIVYARRLLLMLRHAYLTVLRAAAARTAREGAVRVLAAVRVRVAGVGPRDKRRLAAEEAHLRARALEGRADLREARFALAGHRDSRASPRTPTAAPPSCAAPSACRPAARARPRPIAARATSASCRPALRAASAGSGPLRRRTRARRQRMAAASRRTERRQRRPTAARRFATAASSTQASCLHRPARRWARSAAAS